MLTVVGIVSHVIDTTCEGLYIIEIERVKDWFLSTTKSFNICMSNTDLIFPAPTVTLKEGSKLLSKPACGEPKKDIHTVILFVMGLIEMS